MISVASGQQPRLALESLKRGEIKDRRGGRAKVWELLAFILVDPCRTMPRERGQHCAFVCVLCGLNSLVKEVGCGCPEHSFILMFTQA